MRPQNKRYPAPPHTYYYDATNGADANSGQADKPRQTIANVNTLVLKPGDRVLFAGAQTFRTTRIIAQYTGRPGRPIIYGSYGSGVPVLNGSDLITGMVLDSGAIYKKTSYTQVDDVRMGVFQDSVRLIRATSKGGMAAGSFYLDDAGDTLYVWCTDGADPGTHVIEATRSDFYWGIIDSTTTPASYFVVQDLKLEKSYYSGISSEASTMGAGILVQRCEFSFNNYRGIGFVKSAGQWRESPCYAFGNTIHDNISEGIWMGHASGNVIANNELYNCGLDLSVAKGYTSTDCTGINMGSASVGCVVRDNYIHQDAFTDATRPVFIVEYISARPTNCIVERNTIVAGSGIADHGSGTLWRNNKITMNSGTLAFKTNCVGSLFYHNTVLSTLAFNFAINFLLCTNIAFYNNVVIGTVGSAKLMTMATNGKSGFTANNNCYVFSGGHPWSWEGTNKDTLAAWRTASSQDAQAINADPVFVTNYTDLHLQTTSPCKNAGATGLGVPTDYDSVVRVIRALQTAPDIGAYEALT